MQSNANVVLQFEADNLALAKYIVIQIQDRLNGGFNETVEKGREKSESNCREKHQPPVPPDGDLFATRCEYDVGGWCIGGRRRWGLVHFQFREYCVVLCR